MTAETTELRLCGCCTAERQEDEPATCRACVGKVRADLHAIVNLYVDLPNVMADSVFGSNAPRRDQSRSDEPGMPGGRYLVFLAGGSDAAARLRAFLAGVDDDWDQDDRPDDPCSVAWVLGNAEDDWRRQLGMGAAPCGYHVGPAAAFLHLHLQWAANRHPAFADFAEDIRALRGALEHASGTADRPERADAACFDCGDELVRRYSDPTRNIDPADHPKARTGEERWGLEADWSCRGCKHTYTTDGYNLACLQRAEKEGGPWIPAHQAATDNNRAYRTVQTWCRRGILTHRTHDDVLEVRQHQAARVSAQRPTSKAG